MKKLTLTETELTKLIQKAVETKLMEQKFEDLNFEDWDEDEDEEDDPNTVATFPVDDPDFDLSDSDILDINTYVGPKRRGRGSIYIDLMVPETDDKEYDRKVALEMLRYYQKRLKVESYVGGFGFKRGIDFDKEF